MNTPAIHRRSIRISGVLALLLGAVVVHRVFAEDGLDQGLRFSPGHAYRYDVSWSASERVSVEHELVTAERALTGVLRIEAYPAEPDRQLLDISLDSLSSCDYRMMGRRIFTDLDDAVSTLVGHVAMLEIAANGEWISIQFAEAAPDAFRETIRSILTDARLDLRLGKARWETVESTVRGVSTVRWSVRGFRPRITKTRLRYEKLNAMPGGLEGLAQTLDSSLDARLTREGHIETLAGWEDLTITNEGGERLLETRIRFRWSLAGVEPFSADPLPPIARDALEPPQRLDDTRRSPIESGASLGRIARGTTLEVIEAGLRRLALGHDLPADFLWRGGAWLRLHPEDCDALVRLFEDPSLDERARQAVLALLMSAGSEEAQAALRAILCGSRRTSFTSALAGPGSRR